MTNFKTQVSQLRRRRRHAPSLIFNIIRYDNTNVRKSKTLRFLLLRRFEQADEGTMCFPEAVRFPEREFDTVSPHPFSIT
jgi:hypothetical protein